MRDFKQIPWWCWILIIKVSYIICLSWLHPTACFSTDAEGYLTLANNIWNHGTFSRNIAPPLLYDTLRTPGYPWFIILTGGLIWPWLTVFAQQIVQVFAAICLFRIIQLFDIKPVYARLAAVLYLIDIPSFVLSSFLLSDSLFQALLIFCIYLLLKKTTAPLFSALVLILAIYVKPAGIYLGVVWLPYTFRVFPIKKGVIGFGILCMGVGIWCARNYHHHQRFIFSTAGEFNWCSWHGANIIAQQKNIPITQAQQLWWNQLSNSYPHNPEANQVAYSKYISQQSSQLIWKHPYLFIKQTISGVGMLWFKPMRSHLDMQWQLKPKQHDGSVLGKLASNTWLSWGIIFIQALFFLLLYPLALIGFNQLRIRRKLLAYFLLAIVAYFSLMILPPTTYARLKLPITPFIIMFAAVGWNQIMQRKKNKKHA